MARAIGISFRIVQPFVDFPCAGSNTTCLIFDNINNRRKTVVGLFGRLLVAKLQPLFDWIHLKAVLDEVEPAQMRVCPEPDAGFRNGIAAL
jgi:hypothetical protein